MTPAGLPSGVTLVPSVPIGSPYLYSENITAARAYVCPGNAYLASLTIQHGFGITNSVDNGLSTVVLIAGNCSDNTMLPTFNYEWGGYFFEKYCYPLGYPATYTYNSRRYRSLP